MGQILSKKLYQLMPGMIGFHCPACNEMHFFYTKEYEHPGPKWDFNGDVESPTVSPSLAMSTNRPKDPNAPRVPPPYPVWTYCHLFVKNGMIEFLSDCPHELAGQTVPIPDHNRQLADDEE